MSRKRLFLSVAVAFSVGITGLAIAANTYRRDAPGGTQVYLLQDDGTTTQTGAVKFGSDAATPVLPTVTNGANFGVKVPAYLVGTAAVQGSVLVSSNVATGNEKISDTSNSLSVVGVADAAISAGAGYMTVEGYALVLTTGAVSIGDVLVTTATWSGYGFVNNSPASGAIIGIAQSAKTGTGSGLTLTLLK